MASYLLLRDNKESGPYTTDELLSFGLKPYDLVWLQGKSAAWRYPSEVEELKPYAPAVEEQPYDRFYKKDTAEQKEALPPPPADTASSYTPVVKEEIPRADDYSRYAPAAKKEEPAFVPSKSVFVTLPESKQAPVKKNIQPLQDIQPTPDRSPTISVTENPAAAEIKYSQPLDEIKEMYVKTLQQRKDKKIKQGALINLLKKVAVFAGLIALGVLAGFVIKSGTGKDDGVAGKMLQASPLVNNNRNNEVEESTNTSNRNEQLTTDPPAQPIQNDEPSSSKKMNNVAVQAEEPTTIRIRKETMLPAVPKEREEFTARKQEPVVALPSETDPVTGERNRIIRNSHTDAGISGKAVMKSNRNSLYNQVSVASNDYKIVAFGGIRNLYLTVTNNSKYELDNVIVELQYLKPSEEPLRTENIKFRSVAPNSSSTIRVPDTNRGIKVSYKIITIDSKQNSDAVAGM